MQRLLQSARVQSAQTQLLAWLTAGLAPRQLAFTLALGFAIGCIPLFGVTTAICALVALVLRLNMPVIQAANWIAMPFQLVLLVPFMKLGQWIFSSRPVQFSPAAIVAQLQSAPNDAVMQFGWALTHALMAWLITAGPALLLMTLLLTPLIRRVSRQAVRAVK
jgi:uncharacterized protein (DUF2062 family)